MYKKDLALNYLQWLICQKTQPIQTCPVTRGCRIHQLLLCRGVRPFPNECSGYDTKQSDGEVHDTEILGNADYPFIAIIPRSILARSGSTWLGQIELNCILMLNWIVWNRTVLRFFCLQTKTIFILNWIVWIRTFCPEDLGSIPSRIIPKTLKIVLDSSLLNTQQYKVRIKGKVEQSRERSSALPYTSV